MISRMLNVEELLSVSEFEATGDTTQLLAPDLTNLSQVLDTTKKIIIIFIKIKLVLVQRRYSTMLNGRNFTSNFRGLKSCYHCCTYAFLSHKKEKPRISLTMYFIRIR